MIELPRADNDPAQQVADTLREHLRSLPAEELVELAAQLVTTYVVEADPSARAGASNASLADDQVGNETFAGMLKRLKNEKKDPLLERFIIDGENISVQVDGMGVIPITQYRRPTAPPPAAQQRPAPVPASNSIYNRGLYDAPGAGAGTRSQQAGAAAAAAPGNSARPAAPASAQPAGAAGAKKPDDKKPEDADRFKLIELD